MATSLSEPTKKRILQVCVKLFLEQGYKKTTMAEIIEKSSVSSSSFQNISRAKDGVLTELVQFMFENQFSMARSEHKAPSGLCLCSGNSDPDDAYRAE